MERGHFPMDVDADEYRELVLPLTITGGLEKLAGATKAAAADTTSTAVPQSTAARLDATQTKVTLTDAPTLEATHVTTSERQLTEATGSSNATEVKPTAPSTTILTTTATAGSATNMQASVALRTRTLVLVVMALGVVV